MKRGGKHITAMIILLLTWGWLTAQVKVRATVDRDKILIGEPLKLTLEAYLPLGWKFDWIRTDSIPFFEILSSTPPDTAESMDGKKISQSISLTSFDSGQIYIPPFQIMVQGQPYLTDSIPVNVAFTPFDPKEDYRDIKDIMEVVSPSVRYIPWALGVLALASLGILLYLLMKKKKAAIPGSVPATTSLSPYDEAMKTLGELRRWLPAEEPKTYYSELNDIFRNYIARQFGIATFERTNEELILQLASLSLPAESFIELRQSLRMSDFVKFAKYRPSDGDNQKNLDIVRSIIEVLHKKTSGAV